MIQYTIRRILLAIPVIFGILLVTFILARSIKGDPCRAILGEKATKEVCDRFIEEHGLNEPLPVQFGIYVANLARGDFGESIRFSRPISTILIERLPTTIELGLAALIGVIVMSVLMAILSINELVA